MRRFIGLCAGLALVGFGCSKGGKVAEDAPDVDMRALVKVGRIEQDVTFCEATELQGTLRTKASANVAARIPGTIESLDAEEGQSVTNGAVLFQIDRVNLENQVRLAREDCLVARAAEREAQAAHAQASASFEKAKVDAERMRQLYETDKAVTKDAWERADLQYQSADAGLKRADAALETVRAKIGQTETALAVAEKTLADSIGRAPFAGVITRKFHDAGDYVGAGIPIFAMDNPDGYEIRFSLNAADYARVEVGKTEVEIGEERFPVTYKAPSVHPVTRTFEIRIDVPRKADRAPGMLFDGRIVFRRFKAMAVPSSALALRGGRPILFTVDDGKVRAFEAETGAVWQGKTEIRNGEALKDARIVTEGMLLLNEGDSVRTGEE
ncbi:MAG: efflux RND transporter periplasmic adaptor subunit [Kiritimatiellae bacterium]|nr:efflux RND transporter periplasmic adaptor subunit [Kiritimatiellia bacterium]